MTQLELDGYVKLHELWLASEGKEGIRANFLKVDFTGLELKDKDLSEATFYLCNLSKTKFTEVNFSYANFEECKLNRVKWDSCKLESSVLFACKVNNSEFHSLDLTGAEFRDLDTTLTRFFYCDLTDALMGFIRNVKTEFVRCNFHNVLLAGKEDKLYLDAVIDD